MGSGDKHSLESARMTAELFQDAYKKAIEEVKTRIYRDSKSGLDINAYLTKDQIDKIIKDYLNENLRINKAKFEEYLAAKETVELFSDDFSKLVKAAVERYKKHGDKHSSESAKMTAELFQDAYKKAIEGIKTRIYRDSKSGLDIYAYLTKDQIDEIVKDYLDANLRINKAKFAEYSSALSTQKLFDDEYTDLIKKAKEHEKLYKEFKEPVIFDSRSWDWFVKDPDIDLLWAPILKRYLKRGALFQLAKEPTKAEAKALIDAFDHTIYYKEGILKIYSQNIIAHGKQRWYNIRPYDFNIELLTINNTLKGVLRVFVTTDNRNNYQPTIGGYNYEGENGVKVVKIGDGIYRIEAKLSRKDGTYDQTIYTQTINLTKYLK